jgi:hypothetical protein
MFGEIWQPAEILIVARTYPAPAKQGIEVSCTGGITADGRWIRLFPVPYRFLDHDKRFRKYQWIKVPIKKASDHRPESYKLDCDALNILTEPLKTVDNWKARKEIIAPLEAPSLCALQSERNEKGYPTLGFFKPRAIKRLVIEKDSGQWSKAEIERLRAPDLFGKTPAQELEKLPYKFSYEFLCADPECCGHQLMCTDWEMGQSYRKWSRSYPDWEAVFRQRYEREMIEKFDTHFFVGTVHKHPDAWIIIGLFYPPKIPQKLNQMALF